MGLVLGSWGWFWGHGAKNGADSGVMGSRMGLVLGSRMGLVLGSRMGLVLGSRMGLVLGSRMGLVLGSRMGLVLGSRMGLVLGSRMGLVLGSRMGLVLGSRMGLVLGSRMGLVLGSWGQEWGWFWGHGVKNGDSDLWLSLISDACISIAAGHVRVADNWISPREGRVWGPSPPWDWGGERPL